MRAVEFTPAVQLIGAEGHEPLVLSVRRLLQLLVGIGGILIVAVAVQQLRDARRALLTGGHILSSARVNFDVAGLAAHPSRIAGTERQVASAEAQFGEARRDLGPWSPLLTHLGWLPRIGPQLAAAWPAAETAYDATRSAVTLLDGLEPVVSGLTVGGRGSRLPLLARRLADSESSFQAAAASADSAAAHASALPTSLGNAAEDRLLARVHRDLPYLQRGTHLLAAAPGLLGVGRESHLLFVWENPAELRATGGFIGAVDYLTIRSGAIAHEFYGHLLPREITTPRLPLPEAVYTPEDFLLFCDSNWSPDFPLSARLERWFYGEDTGHWASGVVDFVDSGITAVLRVTGPVYLPGYGRWVTATNAQALAQEYVNGRYKGPVATGMPETIRKQFFEAVMKALLRRVQELPLSAFPALLGALHHLVADGELLLYDRQPSLESLISASGAAGRLQPVPGDFVMIVDDNRSYNKINPYVSESGAYSAEVEPSAAIRATLTLRYAVRPSPANVEGYGPDWGRWGTRHDYQDFLRIYVPAGARLLSFSGGDPWAPESAYGLTQFAGRILVREGQRATITLRYLIPPSALGALRAPIYRLTVQREPGGNLRSLSVSVRTLRSTRVGGGLAGYSTRIPLSSNARIQLGLSGVHPPATVLPPASQSDPYLDFASLMDPRHPL
jgi:hypothetical protein